METIITDPAFAERLLRSALGGDPAPSDEQVADLMLLAVSMDEAGADQYTGFGLNRAASVGWQNRAGLAADKYDLGGGGGKTLDRSQWFAHCMAMAAGYADGTYSVVGSPNASDGKRRSGIGVIGLTSSLTRGEVV